jgi:hypothetical protein
MDYMYPVDHTCIHVSSRHAWIHVSNLVLTTRIDMDHLLPAVLPCLTSQCAYCLRDAKLNAKLKAGRTIKPINVRRQPGSYYQHFGRTLTEGRTPVLGVIALAFDQISRTERPRRGDSAAHATGRAERDMTDVTSLDPSGGSSLRCCGAGAMGHAAWQAWLKRRRAVSSRMKSSARRVGAEAWG